MKTLLLAFLLVCSIAHGEWYRVRSVSAYNTISAAPAAGEKDPITIRIRNLEKIEYIQPDPAKVLIGGKEAVSLSKKVLQGQLVWVDNLKAEEGAYAADVYPSFEQVVTTYRNMRIVNGDNVTPETKGKIQIIYKQMIADLNLAPLTMESDAQAMQTAKEARDKIHRIYLEMLSNIRVSEPRTQTIKGSGSNEDAGKRYEGEFERALFTADAIIWFRNKGQYMHPAAQKTFADLLQSFQNDLSQTARFNQIRLEQIIKKEALFRELFLNTSDYERGKFTYTCLDWFKNRGQFLPHDIQNTFITWLRIYQQTNSSDGGFMKLRLTWMMENNGLYQDFLDME